MSYCASFSRTNTRSLYRGIVKDWGATHHDVTSLPVNDKFKMAARRAEEQGQWYEKYVSDMKNILTKIILQSSFQLYFCCVLLLWTWSTNTYSTPVSMKFQSVSCKFICVVCKTSAAFANRDCASAWLRQLLARSGRYQRGYCTSWYFKVVSI